MFRKDDISFSYKYGIIISSKNKDVFLLQKTTLKDDISCIIAREDILPRKYGIPFDRKIKDGELETLI